MVPSPLAGGTGASDLAAQAKAYLGGQQPEFWFDFINNRCLYDSVDVGPVTSAPGWSVTGGSLVMGATGLIVTNQLVTCTANISGITSGYTLWVEFSRGADTGVAEFYLQMFADANNRVNAIVGATDVAGVLTRTAGATVANPSAVAAPAGAVYKIAGRIKANEFLSAYTLAGFPPVVDEQLEAPYRPV